MSKLCLIRVLVAEIHEGVLDKIGALTRSAISDLSAGQIMNLFELNCLQESSYECWRTLNLRVRSLLSMQIVLQLYHIV